MRRRTFDHNLPESEVTPEALYLNRRRFMQSAFAAAMTTTLPACADSASESGLARLDFQKNSLYSTAEEMNSYEDITTYNNFYEFGLGKEDPAENAHTLRTRPWTIAVNGHTEKPGTLDIETLLGSFDLEERIYRLRCVEAWSMVIPWIGIPLADVIKRYAPTSKAKYVAFETLADAKQMPGINRPVIPYPYREGLRMDEAMNPLTILAVGLYGKVLPNQNGAPVRLIVPWKYGFKSIKSIVRMSFTESQPPCTWNISAPREYGFYANVNPTVDHPRWSQASERRIGAGSGFFPKRIDTQMFNGYAEHVAHMYADMDLRKYY